MQGKIKGSGSRRSPYSRSNDMGLDDETRMPIAPSGKLPLAPIDHSLKFSIAAGRAGFRKLRAA
jgi:hypothetical protein